jgi:hypothetical protein
MRFDMLKPQTFGLRDGAQRSNLIKHQIRNLVRVEVHFAAPKTGEIGKRRMRAYGNSVRCGEPNGAAHHRWIARMKPARNAPRRDGASQELVIPRSIDAE